MNNSPELLERLRQEMIDCVVDGVPLPNPVVYRRPWHRDAAMMALAFHRSGDLHRIVDWVASLRDPFDRNNAGQEEPDNLGQCLLLAALVNRPDLPIVVATLSEIPRFLNGDHLTGQTDFGPHPVYQTRWLKLGLQALGLPDPYRVPDVPDSYDNLFWMDGHVPTGPRCWRNERDYPYLAWAEAHTYGDPPPLDLLDDPILTWEAKASQAHYPDPREPVARPHSWHAAEAYLYLQRLTYGSIPFPSTDRA